MFARVRAERLRPQSALRLLDIPEASICLINRYKARLFHFLEENSLIICCALNYFSVLKIRIKILSSSMSNAIMFIVYITKLRSVRHTVIL